MSVIIPSILTNSTADFVAKLELIRTFPGANQIQVDFADNDFVPNLTIQPSQLATLPLQFTFIAHLMVKKPVLYLEDIARVGFEEVAVHYECFEDQQQFGEFVEQAREFGLATQLAIKLETDLNKVLPLFKMLNSILMLGVDPGFYHGEYRPEVVERISFLRLHDFYGKIMVDGGVTIERIQELLAAGADSLIVGSAIFESKNPKQHFIDLVKQAGE